MEKRYALVAKGYDLDKIASKVSDLMQLRSFEIWAPGKVRKRVEARSLLCYWAVRDLGINMTELSRHLNQVLINAGIKRKHPHQINFAHALALSKRLVVVLLQRSTQKIFKILQKFLKLLLKTTEPLRPGRTYPRNVRTQERRFFPTYKPIA